MPGILGSFESDSHRFTNTIKLNENSFDFIISSIESSLANAESVKCLCEADNPSDISYTKCWCKILYELIHSKLERQTPYVTFFQSSIDSFHNLNRISCKTAIIFSLLLWKNLKFIINSACLAQKKISKLLPYVLNDIIELIRVKKLNSLLKFKTANSSNKKILSRHMIKDKSESKYDYEANSSEFENILKGACRYKTQFSGLLWDLIMKSKDTDFNYENILCSVHTSNKNMEREVQEFNYEIVSGLVIRIEQKNLELAQKIIKNNAILIDASLVHDYTHLGFNKKIEFTEFSATNQNGTNYQQDWTNSIKNILIKHNIKVLIVRNKVDSQILEFCTLNSILILNNLPNEIFKRTLAIFKCNCFKYIEDFNEENVVKCELNIVNSNHLNNYYIKIQNCDHNKPENEIISVNEF